MPNQPVSIPLTIYSFTLWMLDKVRDDVAGWGLLTFDSRSKIRKALEAARDDVRPLASMRYPNELMVYPSKLRGTLALLSTLSSTIHSARKVMTDDRRRALGLVARARRGIEAHVQLDLFATSPNPNPKP